MGSNQSQSTIQHQEQENADDIERGITAMKHPQHEKLQKHDELQRLAHIYTTRNYLHKHRNNVLDYDRIECTKENMILVKQIFKQLDPTVMKCTNIEGDLLLSMKYDTSRETLMIKVIRARDLTPRQIRGATADPYVKLKLFPDHHSQGIKETRVTKRTLNPVYHEIFSFDLPKDVVSTTKLAVQIWDHDILSNDDFIGESLIELKNYDFQLQPITTAWFPLQNETDLSITGTLNIALGYRFPQTLLVTVISGHQLAPRDINNSADPFVKIMIPGISTIHQTQVKKNTLNPVWNETFEFTVPFEEFPYRYIVFNTVDHDTIGDNDSMGQIIIDLGNLDPDIGYYGDFELADLKNTDRLRSKWSQKAIAQEFKEALVAHSQFTMPDLLFKRHTGNKVVSLTCRKAGASTRMKLLDGIPIR
ncbi:synaptotagmin-1-like [Tubulanus polymorphus]|uniref:synaptotagmin-1-like n=1 Tax=Tubulanus polymorphus TaxID=672921 RepID=UPI003DA58CAE